MKLVRYAAFAKQAEHLPKCEQEFLKGARQAFVHVNQGLAVKDVEEFRTCFTKEFWNEIEKLAPHFEVYSYFGISRFYFHTRGYFGVWNILKIEHYFCIG